MGGLGQERWTVICWGWEQEVVPPPGVPMQAVMKACPDCAEDGMVASCAKLPLPLGGTGVLIGVTVWPFCWN